MKVSKIRLFSLSLAAIMLVSVGIAVTRPESKTAQAGTPDDNKTARQEDDLTEENQKRLSEATPVPKLDKSLERENLKRRLEFLNDANRLGYVYLLADTGQVISQYTIKGKPSALESYMTTTEQIRCRKGECGVLASPDLDGSYGDNPEGIFFFTTENNYVEWSGKYVYSSERLNLQSPPILTRQVQ